VGGIAKSGSVVLGTASETCTLARIQMSDAYFYINQNSRLTLKKGLAGACLQKESPRKE